MAQSYVDRYFIHSPQKVYKNASKYSKTLGKFIQLPSAHQKSKHVKNLAEDRKDDIKFTIQQSKYQNQLYKKLQIADQKIRRSIEQKGQKNQQKYDTNIKQLKGKKEKVFERMNKHMSEVHKKYSDKQKHLKMQKDQQALKLRKSLLQFYANEKKRRLQADHKQLSVSSCYGDAITRLDKIHQKNQEYAQKSQREHSLRMARNSAKDKNLLNLSRLKSAENKRKQQVYEVNCEILNSNQKRYIQTYCEDLDASIKAFQHKQQVEQKTKERIHKFFKERVQKWHTIKKRVDEQKSHVSDRCTNILDKTSKSFFRQTASSFKQSSKNWYDKVKQNKSLIYERDEHAKDRIMDLHLDLRLRNTGNLKVQQKMASLRAQAKKLSNDFL